MTHQTEPFPSWLDVFQASTWELGGGLDKPSVCPIQSVATQGFLLVQVTTLHEHHRPAVSLSALICFN